MTAKLNIDGIVNTLCVMAQDIDDSVQTLKREQAKLQADWDLETKVMSHLASIPQDGDENIYVRFMQSVINCNKRYPQEVRQLGRAIDRMSERFEQIKARIERIRLQRAKQG